MAKMNSQALALPAPKRKKSPDDAFDVSPVKKKKKVVEEEEKAKKKKKMSKKEKESRAIALYEEEQDDEEEDEKPKKKKKKIMSTEVVMIDGEPKLSKLKGKALRTQFGQGAEKILRLLEQDDTDPAVALIYKRLLQSVVDVMPLAEMGIRASKGMRGIHGFNMLISSLRELMVDVQSAQDRGMMGQTLVMSVMQPAFSDLAQDMVQEFSTLAADVKAKFSQEDYEAFLPMLKESRSRIANRMTFHYNIMRDGTIQFLQR